MAAALVHAHGHRDHTMRRSLLLVFWLCVAAAAADLCHNGVIETNVDRDTRKFVACCRSGCGQSRTQCADSPDVCQVRNRGDHTTRAGCCPSAILDNEEAKECADGQEPPCIILASALATPQAEQVSELQVGKPCVSKAINEKVRAADSKVEMCTSKCNATLSRAQCLGCKCRACPFCVPPPAPPASPPPWAVVQRERLALCSGVVAEDGIACCTLGCGQSRKQCEETDDVCHGTRRGDLTTQANCCPSTIRKAGVVCTKKKGGVAPCVLPGDPEPSGALEPPLPPPRPPRHPKHSPPPPPSRAHAQVQHAQVQHAKQGHVDEDVYTYDGQVGVPVRKYSPPLRSPSPPPPPSPSPPPPPPPRPAKQPDPAASARAAGGRMEAYSASAATSTDFAEAMQIDETESSSWLQFLAYLLLLLALAAAVILLAKQAMLLRAAHKARPLRSAGPKGSSRKKTAAYAGVRRDDSDDYADSGSDDDNARKVEPDDEFARWTKDDALDGAVAACAQPESSQADGETRSDNKDESATRRLDLDFE